VAPHQTGSGGLAPNRPGWGTALTFRTQFRNWFLDSFNNLPVGTAENGYERLPFDQHFQVSLVAPRWIFLDSNTTYGSSRAGFEAIAAAASPVFDLLDPANSNNLVLNWDALNPDIHQFEAYHWSGIMDQADKLPDEMGGILGYLAWRTQPSRFSEEESLDDKISGRMADPDKDGLANLLEFATGSDPGVPSPAPLQILRKKGRFILSFPVLDEGQIHEGSRYNSEGVEYIIEMAVSPEFSWESVDLSHDTVEQIPDKETPRYTQMEVVIPPGHRPDSALFRLRIQLH